MNKQKTLIALGGAIAMISSIFAPEALMAYGLIGLGATLVALTILPLLSLIVNPIVEKALATSFGNALGDKGRSIFRMLFSVPSLSSFRRKKASID